MLKKLLYLLPMMPALAIAGPLQVFVSVLPQKTFVEKIGGDHVQVHSMVRPGHDPHSYDPTTQQIAALAKADLYMRIGVPFEDAWMERIRAANPKMQIVDARAGIELHPEEEHHHDEHHDDEHHDEASMDPHVWTSPPLVKRIAATIRDALTALDPANEQEYSRNYSAYAKEMDDLDREIKQQLSSVSSRRFMVFHPAWGYFADTYGLTQVAIEHEGKEPGARALSALIRQAREEGVKVIFVQPQFSTRSAKTLAHAIGGRVVVIDPLSPDYAQNMRRVSREIAEASGQ
jgi:zinc transport system substrate-binding protein